MSKRTKVEGADWVTQLADAVDNSFPGDVIEVPTWHAAQIGHIAAKNNSENHGIVFVCGCKIVGYLDMDDPPPGCGFDEDGYPV